MSAATRAADRAGIEGLFSIDCSYRFKPQLQMQDLGASLVEARAALHMGLMRAAACVGVAGTKLGSWEGGRTRPSMTSLRRLRDVFGRENQWLNSILSRSYTAAGCPPYAETGDEWGRFWALVHAPAGSADERHQETALLREHRPLALRSARHFRGSADADELGQISEIALLRAVHGYVPTLGPFGGYASAVCRTAVLRHLSDRYYEGLPSLIRNRYALVRRARAAFFASNGTMPTEVDLAEELEVPRGEIRDALQFHYCHQMRSLDEAHHETGRTLHDTVAAAPLVVQTEPNGRIARLLQSDHDAAEEIESHMSDPAWLQVVATRAGMSTTEVVRRLGEALPGCGVRSMTLPVRQTRQYAVSARPPMSPHRLGPHQTRDDGAAGQLVSL